jgi:hypothetical protein
MTSYKTQNMIIERTLRGAFEAEISRLLDIANGEREKERAEADYEQAVKMWRLSHRRSKTRPTLAACRNIIRVQREEIHQLLQAWDRVGRDYRRWKVEQPDQFKIIRCTVQDTRHAFDPSRHNEPEQEPTLVRLYEFGQLSAMGVIREQGRYANHWRFVELLRNPLRADIRVCDRCGRWFLNQSGHRNKRFCARRCAVLNAVTRSVKKRREKNRSDKLQRARRAIRDWTPRVGSDWKDWTAKRTGLSSKFITRAVNRGELRLPAGF